MNRKVLCLMVLTVMALWLTACGSGGATPAAPAPSAPISSGAAQPGAAQPTSAPAAPQALTPQELGDKIGAVYVGSLEAVTKLLENKPDAATALPPVKELKEKTIQQLVELGKQREALGTADRASVDTAINLALMKISNEAWYKTYTDLSQYYFKEQDLQKVLASFNIIGQYANFDLLKKQEPAEAQRLGIK